MDALFLLVLPDFKKNMKKTKNLFYLLLLLIGVTSCKQEELLERGDQQKEFRLFKHENEKQSKNAQGDPSLGRSYALDFLQAFYSYDLLHKTNYTGFNVKAPARDSYVNFRLHSQVIKDHEGNIFMYFPTVKNEQIHEIYYATINKQNTLLGLYKLKNTSKGYGEILTAFEKAYKSGGNIVSKNGGVTDVGEVVITGPSNSSDDMGILTPGQCEMYGQCNNGGGGSGGSSGGGGGGGGGGGTPALPPPPPPTVSISDLDNYLSCLNITQSADLTVYAEEMYGGHGVGHAFISIKQGNNVMTYGFYPKYGFPSNAYGTGIFGDDGGHGYTHSWNVGTISPTQLQQIIAASKAYSASIYDVAFNNCADFTLSMLEYAGVNTNAAGIDTPNTVARLIGGTPKPGTAPASKRTCK